jgi:hypothetical protein
MEEIPAGQLYVGTDLPFAGLATNRGMPRQKSRRLVELKEALQGHLGSDNQRASMRTTSSSQRLMFSSWSLESSEALTRLGAYNRSAPERIAVAA